MNNAQRLIELASRLPEPVLAEIIDFAEYLESKQQKQAVQLSLKDFAGILQGSPNFNGDPVEIQKEMRDEWQH